MRCGMRQTWPLVLGTQCLHRWCGYIGFLPDSLPGMPMCWSRAAVASLAGTSLLDKLAGRKATPGCYVEPPCQVHNQHAGFAAAPGNAVL
jgi:hypothetical protein